MVPTTNGPNDPDPVRRALRREVLCPRWNASDCSITFTWARSGTEERWRIDSPSHLRIDCMRRVGSLWRLRSMLPYRDEKGRPAATERVLAALQDMASADGGGVEGAWVAPDAEAADGSSAHERLVEALLAGWYVGGARTGVVVLEDEATGRVRLRVNLTAALNVGILRDDPQFGRGRRSEAALGEMLRRHPGYVTDRVREAGYRDARWWEIDVTRVVDEDGDAAEHSEVTEAAEVLTATKRRSLSPKLRFEVLRRDGFACRACGAKAGPDTSLEIDHVVSPLDGGSNALGNLRTLCFDCNRGRGRPLPQVTGQGTATPGVPCPITPPGEAGADTTATAQAAVVRLTVAETLARLFPHECKETP